MSKALELAKFGRETPPTGVVVGDSDAQTLSSKTFSDGPVFSGLNANGVPFLNTSKVLSSSSTFVFDGTNIGLGIASPAATLHVNASGGGTIRASRSSVGGEYVQLDHDGTDGTLRVSGSNRLNLITNGINRIIVTGGGNVGIGGALPLEVLSVINSNYESFGLYRNLDYNSVGAMGTRMFFGGYVGSTATRSAAIDGTLMTATTGRLSFSTLIGGTLTEALRIETNGSVRIGGTFAAQSASAEKLTVDGVSSQAATLSNSSDSYGTVYLKNRSTTAATIQPYLYFNDGSGANRGGFGVKYTDASVHQFAQGGINWYVGSAGFSGLAATLTSTGLGINQASPAEKLDIQGNVRIFSGGYPYIDLGISTSNYFRFLHDNPGDRLTIGKNGSANFIVQANGETIVSSSNPSAGISLYVRNTTDTGGDNTRYAGIQFQIGSDQGTAAIQAYRTNSAGDYQTALAFLTKGSGAPATNPTEKMRINSTGGVIIGDTAIQYSSKLYVNGAIAARNGGVDGTYQPAFIAAYTGNYNETNVISSAVSSGGSGSGFSFEISNGAGSASRTSTAYFTRAIVNINTPMYVGGQLSVGGNSLYFEKSGTRSWQLYANQSTGQAYLSSGDGVGNFTVACNRMGIGVTTPNQTLDVAGPARFSGGIISGELIAGYIAVNYTGTRYLLIDNMTDNINAAFNMRGSIVASSYTTWNVCDIYFRRTYSSMTLAGSITGIAQSGVTISLVDITYNSKRYAAICFAGGDPAIHMNACGYRLDSQAVNGVMTFVTSGVTVNSTIATY